MQEQKIVAFVGMPGAGKSYCVKFLEEKGFPSVYFGGITLDEVKARGMEINEVNEKIVREDIRATEGKDAYAKRIIKKIEGFFAQGKNKVVVDGLYTWTEYKIFKDRFGENVTIIAIAAPRHVRHERLANRPVRPLNKEEASARDYAEIENVEKGGPIANADYTILNDSTVEKFLSDTERLLKEIHFL